MYQGQTELLRDFSGGQNSNTPVTELANNEALAVANIVIRANGHGFRQRWGDVAHNSSAMSSSVHGLGYLKLVNGNDFLVAVSGAKIYKDAFTGTMTDITGGLTVTSGQDNHWTLVSFNNKIMGFGGPATNPDAPFVWTGSGNAAALGGTPPSAYGAFQVNNRMFAFRTNSNPSTIYWSVLGNEADWVGVGSGSADAYTSDNDSITAAAILNTNTVLVFKENSILQMQVSAAPFPMYPLFSGVGCAGKHAVVVADGLCYFINNQGRMRITDGVTIYDERQIPAIAKIDDVWAGLTAGRYKYIQGIRDIGSDYDHIVWSCSANSSTTNNLAIVWDLKNRCWLQHPSGYNVNVFTKKQDGTLYAGHYAGDIYKKSVSSASTDASNSGNNVVGSWLSGWRVESSWENIKQPRQVDIGYRTNITGTFKFQWAFDFQALTTHNTIFINSNVSAAVWNTAKWDVDVWSTPQDFIINERLSSRGSVFQFFLSNTTNNQWQINGLGFSGKQYGQKVITAS